MQKEYWVYILSNRYNTVLYTGVTNDLARRMSEHQKGSGRNFTSRYNVSKLLYYETFTSIEEAIRREKQIKGGSRAKKVLLIQSINPGWVNLPAPKF